LNVRRALTLAPRSGRTKDQNIGYVAEYLTVGVDLKEVRVVGDEERAIIDALNALHGVRSVWLLDRQCNRDGGRALDYAGDAR
jgi:hypothetical protein